MKEHRKVKPVTPEDKRNYLRIHIPHLKVKYNILPDNQKAFLPRKKTAYQLSHDEEAELDPIFRVLLDKLESLELKVDYLLKWLGKDGRDKPFEHEAEIIDISGGGLSFHSEQPLKENTMLELCIMSDIGEMSPIFAIGRVCWSKAESNKDITKNIVGICFEDMYEEDRQTIMRMIFHAERKLKKKKDS